MFSVAPKPPSDVMSGAWLGANRAVLSLQRRPLRSPVVLRSTISMMLLEKPIIVRKGCIGDQKDQLVIFD